MLLRVMAVLACLLGLSGIGIALIALQKPTPTVQVAAPPPAPPAPAPVAVAKLHILVAARPQHAGNLMVLEDVKALDVPAGQEPPGSITDSIAARTALRGALLRRNLVTNEPILPDDVLAPGDRGFLAATLGAGMRAVTVGVDAVSGVAGLISPGDHIDLILTQSNEEKDQPIDRRVFGETVLSDIRVIAVDQVLIEGAQGAPPSPQAATQGIPGLGGSANSRTVTLEATSYDAERIVVAARLGRISLAMRAAADDRPASGTGALVATSPVSVPIAWGGDVSPALREHPGARSAGNSILIYRGSKDADEVRF